MFENPLDLINSMKNKKILLVGDIIIDKNTYGTLLGTSAETPTIVAKKLTTNYSLGGAFLVARNLITLGSQVTFITLIGNDENISLINEIKDENLKTVLISDENRPTTVKSRYWVDDYKLLQFDSADNTPVDKDISERIFSSIENKIDDNDLIIFSDYRHGMLTSQLISKSIELAKNHKKTVYVDSQISQMESNHLYYKGANFFLLNQKEAQEILINQEFKPTQESLMKIKEILKAEGVVVKLGSKGSVGLIADDFCRVEALKVKAVDTCGSGDAYLAAYSLIDSELDLESRLDFANYWAGKSTEILGPNPPKLSDL